MTARLPTLVDSHTHVVSGDTDRFPLDRAGHPGGQWVDESAVDADELRQSMRDAGVDRALLVQAHGAYRFDNAYVTEAVAAHPGVFGGVGIVDMAGPDPAAEVRRLDGAGLGGLRLFSIPTPPTSWLDDPGTDPVWETVAELGVRVTVCLLAPELPALGRALARHPDIPVALDHCGFADLSGAPSAPHAQPLWNLAPHENLHVKVTTTILDLATSDGGDPREVVATLAARFGAERLLWGSDHPQVQGRTYGQLVAFARLVAEPLSAPDRERFLGRTALELWPELA